LKITKQQLINVIKEEINRLLSEGGAGVETSEGRQTTTNLDDDWRNMSAGEKWRVMGTELETDPGLGYGLGEEEFLTYDGKPAYARMHVPFLTDWEFAGVPQEHWPPGTKMPDNLKYAIDSGQEVLLMRPDAGLTTTELEAEKWEDRAHPQGLSLPGGQRVPTSFGTQIQSKESGGKRHVVAREAPGWTEKMAADLRRRLDLNLPEDEAARKDREAARVVKGGDVDTKRAIQNALHTITGGWVPKWQSHRPLKGSTLPEFYEDLEKYNLSHVLGTKGEDYSWGPSHAEALRQLKTVKENQKKN
jgi:hypothetical protein